MRYQIQHRGAAHEPARTLAGTSVKKVPAVVMRRSLMSVGAFCSALVLGSLLLSGAETPAVASGFALREQTATGLGNAFAGATAAADDIGSMFFNPASIARHRGNQIVAVGSYLIPRMSFETAEAGTALGTPIAGATGGEDAALDVFIPATYALWDVHPDWKIGIGLNAPFGLETSYDAAWAGRYHAVRSRLRTITATPTVAWRVTDVVSVGAGLQIEYADAILTNAIDFGTIGAIAGIPGAAPAQQDGFADLRGSDVGVGFTLGVLFEPWQGTRLGVGYRSQMALEFTGDGRFHLDRAGIGAALASATGAFTETGVEVDLTTPESLSVGV